MLEVVATFGRCETIEQSGDCRFESGYGSNGSLAEQAFEFGEGLFDGIQIGAVGWQVDDLCAHGFDRFANAGNLVGREVVENQDVPLPERGRELLLHIGQEDGAVHWSINDERSGESAGPQARHKRRCFPMTMRHVIDQPLTTPGAAEAASHLGVGACFVEKHQPPVVEPGPPEIPTDSTVNDVGPLLLRRMQNFF